MIERVCVYCGSCSGRDSGFATGAVALGQSLARHGIMLVYGGASVGLMGTLADAVLAAGGQVTGVIPKHLHSEVAHLGLTEIHITDSMHSRKAMMLELSDAVIAMPGGLGTLDEIFEALSWRQLLLHHKPCGLLNINGYYDQLAQFLDHAVSAGFVRQEHREILEIADTPEALLEKLENHRHADVNKWDIQ